MTKNLARLFRNQAGMAHWILPVALVAVLGVGAVGYKVHQASNASMNFAAQCGSNYEFSQNDDSDTYGAIREFVNQSVNVGNSKKICVMLVSKHDAFGVSKPMSLIVKNRDNGNISKDSGTYKYYAGPLYYSGLTDVYVNGSMTYKGTVHKYYTCSSSQLSC